MISQKRTIPRRSGLARPAESLSSFGQTAFSIVFQVPLRNALLPDVRGEQRTNERPSCVELEMRFQCVECVTSINVGGPKNIYAKVLSWVRFLCAVATPTEALLLLFYSSAFEANWLLRLLAGELTRLADAVVPFDVCCCWLHKTHKEHV